MKKTVVVGGSRRISRLSKDVVKILDEYMKQGYKIVIGDANGVDKQVQRLLKSRGYKNVEVFCVGEKCRNNEGGWKERHIKTKKRGFQAFSERDMVMLEEADEGLFIWDGKSRGTGKNIERMLQKGKPIYVYINGKFSKGEDIKNMFLGKTLFEGLGA